MELCVRNEREKGRSGLRGSMGGRRGSMGGRRRHCEKKNHKFVIPCKRSGWVERGKKKKQSFIQLE